MLALAYDSALRREDLCSLRTDDFDPAHRTLRVRAETTKTRRERVVSYSAPTGVLLADYLRHRGTLSRARGPLFLSESRRNRAEPLTLWTWSKALDAAAAAIAADPVVFPAGARDGGLPEQGAACDPEGAGSGHAGDGCSRGL